MRGGRVVEVDDSAELIELTADMMQALRERKKQELKQARTIEQLIELGKSRAYKYPAQWAQKIMEQRHQWASQRSGVVYG